MRATIIIPAHNAARTIKYCLNALQVQNYPRDAYEIIVVNDGSTDATARIAEGYPITLLTLPMRRGAGAARNLGASAARGDILLFTDADCAPTQTWIREMLAPFDDPRVVGVKGVYRTRQREPLARWVQAEYEEKYVRMLRATAIDFVDTYSAAYRRNVFLANQGFDESFPNASVEDQEFSFRLAKQGHRLIFAPLAVVFHHHPTTLAAYARRKFRIGYWKVRVHRRHPGKIWCDSHTPQTLKMQVGLLPLLVASLVAAPFVPGAAMLAGGIALVLALAMLPLLQFVLWRDSAIAVLAPGLIVVRAAALGTGLIAGVFGEIARSATLKRALDLIGALLLLIACAPIMAGIVLAIKLDSPGAVIFTQTRIGKDGQPFTLWKFRSMVDGAENLLDTVIGASVVPPPTFKIPNDPRVTRVGKILRRFSLDELPQLGNVLRGEMSLVGPRPEESRVVAQYAEWHRRRLAVKPGITGPMQTQGRGALSLDERVRLELDYIENYSLWRDFCLLFQTIPAVVRGTGAY